jgi:hypothetical protein
VRGRGPPCLVHDFPNMEKIKLEVLPRKTDGFSSLHDLL